MRLKLFLATALFLASAAPSIAQQDPDGYKEERLPFGYVRSMDAYSSGFHPTASSILIQAEWENRYGHHDKAIHLCQKALTIDPEDMDVHKCYAESLEKKLKKQKGEEKDINLFLACVREWLIVLRGERGEEKGMTNSKGIGLPGMTHLYRDEDRAMPAREHIIALCGTSPKSNKSDQKFMMEMAKRAEQMVTARIAKKKAEAEGTASGGTGSVDEEVNAKIMGSGLKAQSAKLAPGM